MLAMILVFVVLLLLTVAIDSVGFSVLIRTYALSRQEIFFLIYH
jgi:hypothetical protein